MLEAPVDPQRPVMTRDEHPPTAIAQRDHKGLARGVSFVDLERLPRAHVWWHALVVAARV